MLSPCLLVRKPTFITFLHSSTLMFFYLLHFCVNTSCYGILLVFYSCGYLQSSTFNNHQYRISMLGLWFTIYLDKYTGRWILCQMIQTTQLNFTNIHNAGQKVSRDVLFEFHHKFLNITSNGIQVRSVLYGRQTSNWSSCSTKRNNCLMVFK